MSTLSVIILTRNEENNILDCLEGIKSLDEVIIIDDFSEDRTLELVKSFDSKIKIFQRKLERDFSAQRNFGLSKVTCEWVLFIDADERVSPDLLSEINSAVIENKSDGFLIKRMDIFWDRKLKHGETGSVALLKLARRSAGKWGGKVHETWNVKGRVGELENELIHYPHQSVKEFLKEINLYSSIRADELKQLRQKVSWKDIILYPKIKFLRNYFLKLGFLDGLPGFIIAVMMSFHSFLVRSKLWFLQNEK